MKKTTICLEKYLKTLAMNLHFMKGVLKQAVKFDSWVKLNGSEDIKIGRFYFDITIHSFMRLLIFETCKILSESEKRSLHHWLLCAKDNVESLNPTIYETESGEIEVPIEKYKSLIDGHLAIIEDLKPQLKVFKRYRDKVFGHADEEYFLNNEKLFSEYPITWQDFEKILNLLNEIITKHYSLLLNSSIDLELHSATDIEPVLNHLRGFKRVWHNKKIVELGIRPGSFLANDYDPNDILIKS